MNKTVGRIEVSTNQDGSFSVAKKGKDTQGREKRDRIQFEADDLHDLAHAVAEIRRAVEGGTR